MHHHKLFDDKAELYESSRPTYPAEIYSYLAGLCPAQDLAWDSACGNGQAAVGLIKEFKRVHATDISREQISNAKLHPNIRYEVSPSEKVALENESCDLICVAQALHWFDYQQFWPEATRVLKPNGIFCALGYNWASVNEDIDRIVDSSIMKVIEPFWALQNRLIWNHYRDLHIPFEQIQSPQFFMSVNWNLNEYFNFLHTFSATRRCMDSIGRDFFQRAYTMTTSIWGQPDERKEVNLDFVFYVGRKTN